MSIEILLSNLFCNSRHPALRSSASASAIATLELDSQLFNPKSAVITETISYFGAGGLSRPVTACFP